MNVRRGGSQNTPRSPLPLRRRVDFGFSAPAGEGLLKRSPRAFRFGRDGRERRGFGNFFKKTKRPVGKVSNSAPKVATSVSKNFLRGLGEVLEIRDHGLEMENVD